MPELTVDTQIREGDLIAAKYRVDRVIGRGGMGMVVLATHEQLEQRVALKFLLPEVATRPDLVQRFLREARAAVKIQSEHVARVFDVGTHGALPFMVMEYLEGADLNDVLASRGRLPVREAVAYVLEACDAIAQAHALGIVHRDLKPANLFLVNRSGGKPVVKVLDFGISKAPARENENNITHAQAIMGSPSYMSPEQMVASASVDTRSDVWSLGVVLYELLSTRLPFAAESMPELVGVILQGDFPPLGDDVPVEVKAIIAKCLRKERDQRYQTVAELARALAPFAPPRHAAIVERIETVLEGVAPPSEPQARSVTAPKERTLSPTSSDVAHARRPVWIALAIVAVAGVAIAIAFSTRKSSTIVVQQTVFAPASSFATTSSATLITHDPVLPTASVTPTESATPAMTTPHAHASAHASASASSVQSASPSASPAASCKPVTYFDQEGNKRFHMVCP